MDVRSVLQGLPGHEEAFGHPEVCVAVLDGPVDLSHPCFAGADVTRIDTLVNEPVGRGPMSLHGTHVASLLFGQPRSPLTGVVPRCRGLILPVFRDAGEGRVSQLDLARAIERAVEEGAHIINISGGERTLEGQAESILVRALRMCDESGVLVVAAVGNDGCDCLQVPAAVPSVVAVGAHDPRGEPLASNNWGAAHRNNGVLAPGQDIDGAVPGAGLTALTGSSFAAPAVSGVAALLVAAQLRAGQSADPRAAGRAILATATVPACTPEDTPRCRRHLAGTLNAARAYDLVAAGNQPTASGSEKVPASSEPGLVAAQQHATLPRHSGTVAEGEPPPVTRTSFPMDEGARAMETQPSTAYEEAVPTDGAADDAAAVSDLLGSEPPQAEQAEMASSGVSAAGESPSPGPGASEPNEGAGPMEIQSTPATARAGAPSPQTPTAMSMDAGPETVGSAQGSGIRPAAGCGCGGDPATGCACENAGRRQLVYAVGVIGFDFQTEARRDSFRQQMPVVTVPGGAGRESELPPNPYDPNQLAAYLAKNPWVSDKVTWTLNMDSTPIYALEAEASVGMDWSHPITVPAKAGMEKGKATLQQNDLVQLIETLSHPPVSTVYRIFREAIRGQVLAPEDDAYVSRVSIPGVLTDRTVRLYSGQVVPVVEVKSRGVYTWNEAALVRAVMDDIRHDAEQNKNKDAVGEPLSDEEMRNTLRAFLDKIYYQFRNLGQSSADRALNYAGTNGFLFGSQLKDGILSGKTVVGQTNQLWALDTITVSKSPYCRPGSDCQDVVVSFFDPDNDRRARRSYQFTFDVSDELPVSLAPVHTFLDR
ncbi:S8 family serine peptidase [Streptomyces sp. NPDC006290]|uniref:cyanobactin maturation protease PatG family protein n=1 Tax=Streptomyces sp. NPDC006290 TaxID=3156745 RepID=UPI0033B95A23